MVGKDHGELLVFLRLPSWLGCGLKHMYALPFSALARLPSWLGCGLKRVYMVDHDMMMPLPSWLGCGLNCQQSTLQYTHYRRLRLGTWIEINDLDGVGMPRLPYIVILAGAGIQTECRFYGLL